jgi:hypothetical protein
MSAFTPLPRCALLGYCAVSGGNILPTFRGNLPVLHSVLFSSPRRTDSLLSVSPIPRLLQHPDAHDGVRANLTLGPNTSHLIHTTMMSHLLQLRIHLHLTVRAVEAGILTLSAHMTSQNYCRLLGYDAVSFGASNETDASILRTSFSLAVTATKTPKRIINS